MKKIIALVLVMSVPAFAVEDAPRLDSVKLDDPQVTLNVARYVTKLEVENAALKKNAPVSPLAVVAIAVGAALVGAAVTAGVYEGSKAKP